MSAAAGFLGQQQPAMAFVQPPDGYRSHVDRCEEVLAVLAGSCHCCCAGMAALKAKHTIAWQLMRDANIRHPL